MNSRKITYSIILCSFILGVSGYSTAENLPTYYGYSTIEGSLLPELDIRDLTAFVTIIDVNDLIGSYSDVSQVLSETVGLKVNRFGGQGSFSTVTIRGSTAEQVLVFLDGILLNKASGGAVDLSTIPLENIDHIEIFRGMSPSSLGASSLGGVINIVTRKNQPESLTTFKTGFGSMTTGSLNLHHSSPLEHGSYLVNLDMNGSRGNFSYLDDNGTDLNTADDEWVKRRNNGHICTALFTRLGIKSMNNTNYELSNHLFMKAQGIPGIGNFQSETANLDTLRNVLSLKVFKPDFIKAGTRVSSTFFLSYLKQSFTDETGEIGVGVQKNHNSTWLTGGNVRTTYPFSNRNLVTLFTEARFESFTPFDELRDPQRGSTNTRFSVTFTAEDEIVVMPVKWVVNPSFRIDCYKNSIGDPDYFLHLPGGIDFNVVDILLSGKIGTRYNISSMMFFQANIGKFHRIPDFAELYGNRGYIIGNPTLKPETSINADMGIGFSAKKLLIFRNLAFQGNYFLQHADDLIQYIQNAQGIARAENLESALIQGLEINTDTILPGAFTLKTNYTFLLSKDTSEIISRQGNRLPNSPVHDLNLKIRHGLWRGVLEYGFEFISSNYLDRANLTEVPHRFYHGLAYRLPIRNRYIITIEGKNLTDNQTQDYRGYPLPGRSFFVKFEVTL